MTEPAEIHISSMVVHTTPGARQTVRRNIENLPGAEVYAESERGKLVVVLESQGQAYITEVIDKINNLDQVLSTVLVYHQIEQPDALEGDTV